jgi:hypothetical protein
VGAMANTLTELTYRVGSWGTAARAAHRCGTLLAMIVLADPAAAKCGDSPTRGVDWSGCSKNNLMLGRQNLAGANFQRATLTGTDFSGSNLSGTKLPGAELSFVRFEGADLSGADFTKAAGGRTILHGQPCLKQCSRGRNSVVPTLRRQFSPALALPRRK